jgi:hypothetical protein
MSIYGCSTNNLRTELVDRERRLKNLSKAVGAWLEKEVQRNKTGLSNALTQRFAREITLADTCVYQDDLDGPLCHGLVADLIHDTLKDLDLHRH